ncbi:RagB/SusD family nutrient uptake outer membrane protein [Pedobacter agri]|uniref:RagB/SusD family nutrient uptake outer membrane protein n=1 Tax=Pedobacter agri TaxID=454586 RepID=UPI00292D5765|nr:RagB/SusD family nutrient uptake outer membrane protein [Pedobacter agri]
MLCVLAISGCKKYLDVKSDAKLVVPSTISDLQGILDDASSMNLVRTPSYGDNSADDYFLPKANYDAVSVNMQAVYKRQRREYRYANDWSVSYLPIYNANLCLEILDEIERTPLNGREWDNVKGSGLFFRSYYIYLMTVNYGLAYDPATSANDLGVVLRLNSDFNVPSQRSSVEDCLERAISDTQASLNFLPETPLNQLRPSKAAGYALLARIYLYMNDYVNATRYADECLRIRSQLMDFNNDSDIIGLDQNIPFRRFNKETIFYTEMYSGFGMLNTTRAKIDTNLYASYSVNDLRRRAYFRANGLYQQFKGSYSSSSTTFFSGFATDELYLIRAEGRAYMGNLSGAMEDLNLLLKSRWRNTVPYVPVGAANVRDALTRIRIERRKELLMRNLRWADIKRLNKDGENIVLRRNIEGQVFDLLPNDPFYALPLPDDIIQQTGMQQN